MSASPQPPAGYVFSALAPGRRECVGRNGQHDKKRVRSPVDAPSYPSAKPTVAVYPAAGPEDVAALGDDEARARERSGLREG
jgi:hypothetical protein